MKKVFLSGSLSSPWRDEIIPMLIVDYFNPCVEKATKKTRDLESLQFQECDYILYVITPDDFDIQTVAQAVEDSNKRPEKTIFCCPKKSRTIDTKFSKKEITELKFIIDIIHNNGAIISDDLLTAAGWLNSHK